MYDLKEYERGLRMDELSVKCLLYSDDQVILALSACGPQEMVNKMNGSVKKRSIKTNVWKTKFTRNLFSKTIASSFDEALSGHGVLHRRPAGPAPRRCAAHTRR
ncbi:hypothetical protein EVAR_20095_1 [Eumeta japonica]|uniref:Reverse transcriptase domain-containing protein n=1 Tax=Eumeta variegata TaxID=151549 RepID=A0A4C1V277_EUMVA|nr:hypothetical protein EVAR_20095_1 [Eumeta japonica]